MTENKIISIFCGSKDTTSSQYISSQIYKLIYSIPREIDIAYGGGTHGLMKQIYQGVKDKNSKLITINCEKWRETSTIKNDLHIEYYYDSIIDRQNHLVQIADAYIVCPGGIGTLYEALQVITLNDVQSISKPIYVFNLNNYFMHLFNMLEHCRKIGTIYKTNEELNIHIFDQVESLVESIKSKK